MKNSNPFMPWNGSVFNAGVVGSIPGLEDPLKEQTATLSSILACEIPWTEEPGRLQSRGVAKKLDTKEQQNRRKK